MDKEVMGLEGQVRFPLQVCFVHPRSLTHFYDGEKWVEGKTHGVVTSSFVSALEDWSLPQKWKVLPLIPLGKLARSLNCKKAAGLMLLLTRYYAVPVIPVVTSENKRKWFVVPCYGFFQFLREFAGIEPSQIDFIYSVDISHLSEEAKRAVLAKLTESRFRWEAIDKLVFVPLELLYSAADCGKSCRWSFKTAVIKGFQALLRSKPVVEVSDDKFEKVSSEIKELIDSVCDAFSEYRLDQTLTSLESLISRAFLDRSEEFRRTYVRLLCDGPSFPFGEWWDLVENKVNPLFAIYYEARRKLFCRIFKRAKLTEREVREYAPYWSPKPRNLLTRALQASYARLVKKNADKFSKLAARGIESIKVAVTALQDRVFYVPVPKEAFERLMVKLEVGWSTAESFVRWTFEHFGFRGLRFVLYGDRAAAVAVYNTAISFPNLAELFGKFYETIVHWADKVVVSDSRREPLL